MALTLGTNSGFVTARPTGDPAVSNSSIDKSSYVIKDTSSATAGVIIEMGWYCINNTEESNFEVGLYSADGTYVPGEAGTRLYVSTTNAKGTNAGWKVTTGLNWAISPNTAYWLGLHVHDTVDFTLFSTSTTGGVGLDSKNLQSALPNPFGGNTIYDTDGNAAIYAIWVALPTVTTQAVGSVAATAATGNGNITNLGGDANCTKRGIVYSTSTHGDPGNVAPASSAYGSKVEETGTYTTGAFTESLTGLVSRTTYYARAYTFNSAGYAYGAEVNFTTPGFTNPANIYSSNNVYATLAATSGILTVEVSKDAGANWQTPKTVTFTGSDSLQTVGLGATELFGSSFTRADMVDANFRIRLSHGNISQVYKTFGFSTGSDILTGIEIAIEGNYASSTLSLDLLEVKIHYGTSILPVQAGSQAFASDGRKAGEGAGAGTGLLTYYDGTNWIASDTGAVVSA